MNEKTKQTLVLVASIGSAVLVAAIITLLVLNLMSRSSCCERTRAIPLLEPNAVLNVPSNDFKALAALAGYLKFDSGTSKREDHNKTPDDFLYLNLQLRNVTLYPTARGAQVLDLRTNCANLTLTLIRKYSTLMVDSLKVSLMDSDANFVDSCLVNPNGIYMGQDENYQCNSRMEFTCELSKTMSAKKNRLASIVLEILKFEVNGKQDIIKKKQFSKRTHFCF